MLILGLNAFHADASAAIVDADTGRLVGAVAEERLNRVKHFAGFPGAGHSRMLTDEQALTACRHFSYVAIARDGKANLLAKLGFAFRNLPKLTNLARQRLQNRADISSVPALIAKALEISHDEFAAQVHHVEHHLAHLASSFLVSPFEKAALLSVDGFGDFASTMTGIGEGSSIRVLDRTLFPYSLGILYTAICQFIGYSSYW